jgi:hypothetical protein
MDDTVQCGSTPEFILGQTYERAAGDAFENDSKMTPIAFRLKSKTGLPKKVGSFP